MSEKTTPYDVEIARLEGQIKAIEEAQVKPLQVELHERRLRRAEFLCPFKIGDVVVRHGVTSAFQHKKDAVIRARVTEITPSSSLGIYRRRRHYPEGRFGRAYSRTSHIR